MKKTVVIGASENSDRYSYKAVLRLKEKNHVVVPVGKKEGEIDGTKILKGTPHVNNVNTVSIYINPALQKEIYDYIISDLKPKRVIFNPGTENPEFEQILKNEGVETIEACTLVMLSVGNY